MQALPCASQVGDDVADEMLPVLFRHDLTIESARLDKINVAEHIGVARRRSGQVDGRDPRAGLGIRAAEVPMLEADCQ
jgi:hypothetical protein